MTETSKISGRHHDAVPEPSSLFRLIEKTLIDGKSENIYALDVTGQTVVTDYIIIAGGRSSRHLRGLADKVLEVARADGVHPVGVEGYEDNEWILLDFGDVVLHLMSRYTRDYYELEKLWPEARKPDTDSS